MSFILTLVSSDPAEKPLRAGHLARLERYIDGQGLALNGDPLWLSEHEAVDLPIVQHPEQAQWQAILEALSTDRIDAFIVPAENRRKKLLLADMDSTIISSETLDEIATMAGVGNKVAPITERAMRGELDFVEALNERVALLQDAPATILEDVKAAARLNDGAKTLVKTMAAHGATCVLVSGGFTFLTEAVAQEAGFQHHHGNVLEEKNGTLTGKTIPPVLDKNSKLSFLHQYKEDHGLDLADTMALGDGANDLPMLEGAGLGIGYHPKPLLRQSLYNCILYGTFRAALFAQGFRVDEFVP